ncbi:MAG: Gfo/Idh/MocA family oxidoreductase [Saprospiraceae bacterium]|nr:Gfo/Idh/MocA family oxidoreductase [Saprospiraceae bacterium]
MHPDISRRLILKALGIGTLGTALPKSAWATNELGTPLMLADHKTIPNQDRPLTAITLGAGNRGNVYGNYGIEYPERLNIVGVAEPIEIRKERYMAKHEIPSKNAFVTWEHVFEREKFADAIIITTPDDLHYGPCMKALELGYHVLLEKPISPSEKECRDILAMAQQQKKIVAVCHVLRYAPYFQKLQDIIQSGALGKVVSMQHFEPIQHIHMSHSFVRGNWHNSKATAPIILAKSCHDLDIIKWMLNKTCKQIHAFGNLSWFNGTNKPEGSTARCTDGCKVEATCPYSALKIYYRNRNWLHHFDLPEDPEKHGDTIMEYLKTSNYGRCVYDMDNDQPDHYTTNILFEDDVTVSFSMEAFTSYHGRRTRIMGSMGDIVGDMSNYIWTDFRTGEKEHFTHQSDGHGGGDWNLVSDWIAAVVNEDESLLTSTIADSIESHIMGFAAEKSRLNNTVESVNL